MTDTIGLVEVARSDRQWTGVAVSREGRIFVNYSRWSDAVTFSVGKVMPDGEVKPYPDEETNNWGVRAHETGGGSCGG